MNLLIVDDQKQVLEGIKKSIRWTEFAHISNAYYAYNAAEAKNYFLNNSIDILVSDIEMPGENGLQLLSWVQANFPETKCILLTAHASFDYAQDALRLKAIDYILQPVQYETLKEVVLKAVRLILEEQEARSPEKKLAFWDNFREDAEQMTLREYITNGDYQAFQKKTGDLNIYFREHDDFALLLIDEAMENHSLDQWAEGNSRNLLLSLARHFYSSFSDYLCVFEQHSHHFWMLLHASDAGFDYKSSSQSFIDFCRENDSLSVIAYVGAPVSLSELPSVYQKLYKMYRNNVSNTRKLFTLDDENLPETPPMPASASWAKLFCDQMTDVIEEALLQYIRRTSDNGAMNSRTLLSLQQTFLNAFYESLHLRGIRIRYVFENEALFEKYTFSTHSVDDFLAFVRSIFEYNGNLHGEADTGSSVIEIAQEYISSHLSDDLSREIIAQETHVSESYLSHLFPRETGLSLTDYITQERITLAKSLLTTTSLPVQIISLKAGYQNFSYFLRTFKRICGVTPNDFRKKQQ